MIVLSTETVLGSKKLARIQHHGGGSQMYFIPSNRVDRQSIDRRVKISEDEARVLRTISNRLKGKTL